MVAEGLAVFVLVGVEVLVAVGALVVFTAVDVRVAVAAAFVGVLAGLDPSSNTA